MKMFLKRCELNLPEPIVPAPRTRIFSIRGKFDEASFDEKSCLLQLVLLLLLLLLLSPFKDSVVLVVPLFRLISDRMIVFSLTFPFSLFNSKFLIVFWQCEWVNEWVRENTRNKAVSKQTKRKREEACYLIR